MKNVLFGIIGGAVFAIGLVAFVNGGLGDVFQWQPASRFNVGLFVICVAAFGGLVVIDFRR